MIPRNISQARSNKPNAIWRQPIAGLLLSLAVSSGCVVVPEGNLGEDGIGSCAGGSCQCGAACDGGADDGTGGCPSNCNDGGGTQGHEAMPAVWSPLLTACAIPTGMVGNIANFCLAPIALPPPELPPPGRFHPVPTHPVFGGTTGG